MPKATTRRSSLRSGCSLRSARRPCSGANSLGACGDLLARAAAAPRDRPAALRPAVAALIDALPGDPSRAPPRDPWRRGPGVSAAFVVHLFRAVAGIDGTMAERAAGHMLAWPKSFG